MCVALTETRVFVMRNVKLWAVLAVMSLWVASGSATGQCEPGTRGGDGGEDGFSGPCTECDAGKFKTYNGTLIRVAFKRSSENLHLMGIYSQAVNTNSRPSYTRNSTQYGQMYIYWSSVDEKWYVSSVLGAGSAEYESDSVILFGRHDGLGFDDVPPDSWEELRQANYTNGYYTSRMYITNEGCTTCASKSTGTSSKIQKIGSSTASVCLCIRGTYGSGHNNCTDCPMGTYSDTVGAQTVATCIACPDNSTAMPGSRFVTDCTCNAGLYGDDGTSCTLCATGKFKNASGSAACVICSTGKYSGVALGAITCSTCPAGSTSAAESSTASACTCSRGYVGPNSNECVACTPGTFSGSDGDIECTLCHTHANSPARSTHRTDCTCNVGFYRINETLCQQCLSGTYAIDTGSLMCTLCEAGKYSTANGSSDCAACPLGTYAIDTGSLNCTICEAGKYSAVNGSSDCAACPLGTYAIDTGSLICTLCETGKYSAANGSKDCAACPLGTYNNVTGAIECTSCAAGTFSDTEGETVCQDCLPGTYTNNTGSLNCTQCEAGKYSDASGVSTCKSCPDNSNVEAGSDGQTDCTCNAGWYRPNDGACSACAVGTYKNMPGDAGCTSCPAGTISYTQGKTVCQDCLPGTYTSNPGNSICTQCEAGKYSDARGVSTCESCPDNSNSEAGSENQTDCTCNVGFHTINGGACAECTPGTYADDTGSLVCSPCTAGKYSATSGASVCDLCPDNSNSEEGGDSQIDCMCNAGFYGGDGTACRECVAGTYKSQTGSAACISCPAGSYSTAVGATTDPCQSCPGNSNSETGSASAGSCTCNVGYFGDVDSTCKACDEINNGIDRCVCDQGMQWDGSQCTNCVRGTYKSVEGTTQCILCKPGTYSGSVAAVTADRCRECPAGHNSPAGSHDDSLCYACPANSDALPGSVCTDDSAWLSSQNETCANYDTKHYCAHGGVASGWTFIRGSTELSDHADSFGTSADTACCECGTRRLSTCTCNAGWKRVGVETCAQCPSNSNAAAMSAVCKCNAGFSGPDDGVCTQCAPGTYTNVSGASVCAQCEIDTYSSTARTACLPCPAHSASPAGSFSPINCACNAGSFRASVGVCAQCAAGKYTAAAASVFCISCGIARQSPAGSNSLSNCTCKAGMYARAGDHMCCPPGQFLQPEGDRCLDCALHTYSVPQNAEGPRCAQCPAHMHTRAPRAHSVDVCACNAGYGATAPNAACTACVPGKSNTGDSDDTCAVCAVNTFTARSLAKICTPCPEGFVARNKGSKFCVPDLSSAIFAQGCSAGTVAVSMHELPSFVGIDVRNSPL